MDVSDEDAPLCAAGVALFGISAKGDVYPCSQYPRPTGNIRNSQIEDIVFGKRMRESVAYCVSDIKEKGPLYNYCIGNNFSETGHPLRQPEFLRRYFKAYRKERTHEKDQAHLEEREEE